MPRQFLRYMIPHFDIKWEAMRQHLLPILLIITGIMAFYFASVYIAPGWLTYFLSMVCMVLLGLTAVARVNDIGQDKTEYRWQLRRFGLILVASACFTVTVRPFAMWVGGVPVDWPSWGEVMFRAGVLFTWMTTPFMPPWHRYMSGEYRKVTVEVPADASVNIERTETDAAAGDGMFVERRVHPPITEDGP